MRKMYKIFGAAAIIGLFLIGSMSTGLAVQQPKQIVRVQGTEVQRQQVQVQPGQQPQMVDDELPLMEDPQVATYQDIENGYPGTYTLTGYYPDETTPYPATPILNPDLCVTTILRYKVDPSTAKVWVRVRNIGLGISAGGEIDFYCRAGLWIYSDEKSIYGPFLPSIPLIPKIGRRNYFFGPITPFLLPHLVLVHLNIPDDAGGIRGINWRVGAVLGVTNS